MENEIMNKEAVENIVDTGRNSKAGKIAKAIGLVGLSAGLLYLVYKAGKKLAGKVKAKRATKKEAISADKVPTDEMFEDLGELEE